MPTLYHSYATHVSLVNSRNKMKENLNQLLLFEKHLFFSLVPLGFTTPSACHPINCKQIEF